MPAFVLQRSVLRGNIRTARARRPILCWLRQKLAHLELPHKSQEGVSKVPPSFEVDESIFGLGFTQFYGFANVLSN